MTIFTLFLPYLGGGTHFFLHFMGGDESKKFDLRGMKKIYENEKISKLFQDTQNSERIGLPLKN